MMDVLLAQMTRAGQSAGVRVAAWALLAAAATAILLTGPGPIPVGLALAATVAFALDPRCGPIGAGLLVLLALPYGRGADTLAWQPVGVTIRPHDGVLLVALLGGGWVAYRNRTSWGTVPAAYRLAFALVFGVGVLSLVVGVLGHNHLRDIGRDLRVWVLFVGGLLALVSGLRRSDVVRAMLLGSTALAVVILAGTLLPEFAGGVKAQTLAYDRGTLRMQFGNSIFLIPAIAYATWLLLDRRRPVIFAWLLLLLTAVVLSLTRMSILAALAVVILSGLLSLVKRSPSWPRTAATVAVLVAAVFVAGAAGVAANLVGTPNASSPGSAGSQPTGENPIGRILGQSDASDFTATLGARSGRIASYLSAYSIIRAHPIAGVGMGTLVPVGYAYSAARAHTVGYQSGVDDAYLTMGVKAGVLGITALAGLFLLPLLTLVRRRRDLDGWFLPAWLGILALTLPQAFAMSGYAPFGLTLLAVVPALAAETGERPERRVEA